MAKIKIKDLPRDMKISDEELRQIRGGFSAFGDRLAFRSGFDWPGPSFRGSLPFANVSRLRGSLPFRGIPGRIGSVAA